MYAIIHDEMLQSLSHLNEETQGKIILAYIKYQMYGVEPSKDDVIVYTVFKAKQFDLDSSINKAEVARKNGKKGGRPRKDFTVNNSSKTKKTQTKPNHNPTITQKNQEKEKEKEKEKETYKEKVEVEEFIEKWNGVKVIKTPQGNVAGLKQCRGPTEDMRKERDKVVKAYTKEQIAQGVNNYIDEIRKRDKNHGYYAHRFSLYEFITQGNGLKKFINV